MPYIITVPKSNWKQIKETVVKMIPQAHIYMADHFPDYEHAHLILWIHLFYRAINVDKCSHCLCRSSEIRMSVCFVNVLAIFLSGV